MSTPLAVRLTLKWHARHFVRAMYLALLGREPDAKGLAAYEIELRRDGDLERIARAIASSQEAWEKALYDTPARVVSAAFRGLLGRDPEHEALFAYGNSLGAHRDLPAILDDIARSNEHWLRLLAANSEDIVRAVFLALLKREPEPEALATYAQELRQSRNIESLIASVGNSDEHYELLSESRRQSRKMLEPDNLPTLLAEVVKAPKVWNELVAQRFPSPDGANAALTKDAWVFIHAQKTGGTSLQNMLVEALGDRQVYREHGDSLYMRSAAELAPYSVFAGHFNHDTVDYIPRQQRKLVTILREPRARLMSHYRFLRAHKPSAPRFKGAMEIANRLEPAEFFRSVMTHGSSDFWNHLTWCVMGQRTWNAYRAHLQDTDGQQVQKLLDTIRADIRARLDEFAFVGLQEDLARSCQRLFTAMDVRVPALRHDHSVEMLSANGDHFRNVERRPLTSALQDTLNPLVALDDLVYQEGKELYRRRYSLELP